VAGGLTGHPKWWSQEYFGQVARRVDQIAVMSYDTAMPLQSLYGGYVAQQTSLALEVTPPSTDLLIGLPFYHENDIGHHASAETVTAAVRGARLGLSRTDPNRPHFGVALYVDFAATAADWAAYHEGWVRCIPRTPASPARRSDAAAPIRAWGALGAVDVPRRPGEQRVLRTPQTLSGSRQRRRPPVRMPGSIRTGFGTSVPTAD
jgi:hypothetical protein